MASAAALVADVTVRLGRLVSRMQALTGDAFVYAKDVGQVVIWVKHEPKFAVTVNPPEGISWQEYTDRVATPALFALGWRLNNWHRPRANIEVIATAFVWRTPD